MPDQFSTAVLERDGLRVHTFTAPPSFLANSTHVLETAEALVVIDGQFVAPYAKAFREYVNSLQKPIERVYLSHAHVDHWFGLSTAFADVPVHAAAPTIAALQRHGESERAARAAEYGPMVPASMVLPSVTVLPGPDVVDGVKLEVEIVEAAECEAQLLLTLPDHGVTVAQDLVYSGTHVYVTRDTAHTISLLDILEASASDVFLAGHGPVADRAEVHRNIDYLAFAQDRLANDDAAAFKAALLARFPDRACPELLDIFIPRLFGGSS